MFARLKAISAKIPPVFKIVFVMSFANMAAHVCAESTLYKFVYYSGWSDFEAGEQSYYAALDIFISLIPVFLQPLFVEWYQKRGFKEPVILVSVLAAVGFTLCAFAPTGDAGRLWFFISYLCSTTQEGLRAVRGAFLVKKCPEAFRSKILGLNALFAAAGTIFGAGASILLAAIPADRDALSLRFCFITGGAVMLLHLWALRWWPKTAAEAAAEEAAKAQANPLKESLLDGSDEDGGRGRVGSGSSGSGYGGDADDDGLSVVSSAEESDPTKVPIAAPGMGVVAPNTRVQKVLRYVSANADGAVSELTLPRGDAARAAASGLSYSTIADLSKQEEGQHVPAPERMAAAAAAAGAGGRGRGASISSDYSPPPASVTSTTVTDDEEEEKDGENYAHDSHRTLPRHIWTTMLFCVAFVLKQVSATGYFFLYDALIVEVFKLDHLEIAAWTTLLCFLITALALFWIVLQNYLSDITLLVFATVCLIVAMLMYVVRPFSVLLAVLGHALIWGSKLLMFSTSGGHISTLMPAHLTGSHVGWLGGSVNVGSVVALLALAWVPLPLQNLALYYVVALPGVMAFVLLASYSVYHQCTVKKKKAAAADDEDQGVEL